MVGLDIECPSCSTNLTVPSPKDASTDAAASSSPESLPQAVDPKSQILGRGLKTKAAKRTLLILAGVIVVTAAVSHLSGRETRRQRAAMLQAIEVAFDGHPEKDSQEWYSWRVAAASTLGYVAIAQAQLDDLGGLQELDLVGKANELSMSFLRIPAAEALLHSRAGRTRKSIRCLRELPASQRADVLIVLVHDAAERRSKGAAKSFIDELKRLSKEDDADPDQCTAWIAEAHARVGDLKRAKRGCDELMDRFESATDSKSRDGIRHWRNKGLCQLSLAYAEAGRYQDAADAAWLAETVTSLGWVQSLGPLPAIAARNGDFDWAMKLTEQIRRIREPGLRETCYLYALYDVAVEMARVGETAKAEKVILQATQYAIKELSREQQNGQGVRRTMLHFMCMYHAARGNAEFALDTAKKSRTEFRSGIADIFVEIGNESLRRGDHSAAGEAFLEATREIGRVDGGNSRAFLAIRTAQGLANCQQEVHLRELIDGIDDDGLLECAYLTGMCYAALDDDEHFFESWTD